MSDHAYGPVPGYGPASSTAFATPVVPAMSTPRAPAAARRRDDVPAGIIFMIAASLLFAVSSALAKWLVGTYPVGEVMFFRSFSSLIIVAIVVLPFTGFAVFSTKRPRDHIARGLSQSVSQTFTVIALWLMPLAGAIAINFSAPLFAALVSIVFLKEFAGPARWSFILIGFFGVLVVANPGADSLQIGALFALANAIMYGSVTVAVRGMSKTESANTLLMWQLATVAFFHTSLLFFGFKWPTPVDTALLVFSGVVNVVAQYYWTRALFLAPAPAVSPFYYFLLVWALMIDFAIWGEIPTIPLLIGSGIVVASGLLLLWHESQSKAKADREQAVACRLPPSSLPRNVKVPLGGQSPRPGA
jgi:drug/metabolite transporter (DMT)-like permease